MLLSTVAGPIYISPTVHTGSLFSTSLPIIICCIFNDSNSNNTSAYKIGVLIYTSLMIGDVDHVFVSHLHAFGRASLVALTVKNLPAMWEAQVQSLGQENPLEKEMAIHSSILA